MAGETAFVWRGGLDVLRITCDVKHVGRGTGVGSFTWPRRERVYRLQIYTVPTARTILLGGDFVCDNLDPKKCTACTHLTELIRGAIR